VGPRSKSFHEVPKSSSAPRELEGLQPLQEQDGQEEEEHHQEGGPSKQKRVLESIMVSNFSQDLEDINKKQLPIGTDAISSLMKSLFSH
jgi:hypothetical protein